MNSIIHQGKMTFFTWENSENWPVCEVSENVLQLLGYSSEEFLSGDARYAGLIHPEDLPLVMKEVSDALDTRCDEFTHQIYRVKHKDGSYKKVYDHTKVLYGLDGTATHFRGCIYDKTEELLQKERLELVLEGTGLGLWDWNPQTGEVVFDQQWAKMLGYELSELDLDIKTWENKVHPDDLENCFEDLQNHMLGKTEYYQNTHRMKHKSGHWLYIWDRGKVVEWDREGKAIRFTGTLTDITKQKTAENDLIKEMKAKESFFALMSHEIRTPMNGILGFTDLMLEDESLSEEHKDSLNIIRNSSDSLLQIINDILDYAKLDSGTPLLESRPFNLEHSLNFLIQSLFTISKMNNNKILLDIDQSMSSYFVGDEGRLLQVLRNLISNALKFSKDDTICVKVYPNDGQLQFEVSDNGVGINSKQIERLFLPFIQQDSSTTREFGGTGLGLTLCKSLVELMNGRIWVESSLGNGATFYFTVTLQEDETPKAESKKKLSSVSVEGSKVLLVEDNEANMAITQSYLQSMGCEIVWAKNGLEAFNLLKTKKGYFDLVLMDLFMPIMGGLEATKQMFDQLEEKEIPPIVALTANGFNTDRKSCFDAGMVDFMVKPLNKTTLLSVLQKHIKKDS
ncbi:MAG: PAS domain-containing protein [Candidatus Cloacimonetes bacterium]|nr:PAS domain-containing protein [Candidatus Cloacimonadota bacterium]